MSHDAEPAFITGPDTGIALVGKAYITAQDLSVTRTKTFLDCRNANHIWVFNCTMVNSSEHDDWALGIKMYDNSRHNWLANSTIGDAGYMTEDDDIGGVMNLGNWENSADTTSHNLIENNHFFHGGHHIIEIASKYNVLRNNTFHNENFMPCARSSTGNICGNRDIVIYDVYRHATYNIFEGNRFAFAGASIDDNTGSSGASIRSTNNIIRNNMFYLNDGVGMGLYVDSDTEFNARDNYVYGNVFYKNGISPLSASDYRYTFGLGFDNVAGNSAPLPIRNVSVKNNIFYGNAGGDIFFYYTNPALQTVLGNYYKLASASDSRGRFSPEVSGYNIVSEEDPLFADISSEPVAANVDLFDFRLRQGSAAIDKGVFLTNTTGAGSGTVLPILDVGYFTDGLGIIPGDIIQLDGQAETAQVVSVDYSQNTLTLDASLTWDSGQGVGLQYYGDAPDIGAFETYGNVTLCIHPAETRPCDGCFDAQEFIQYVSKWMAGTTPLLIDAIELWKQGCP